MMCYLRRLFRGNRFVYISIFFLVSSAVADAAPPDSWKETRTLKIWCDAGANLKYHVLATVTEPDAKKRCRVEWSPSRAFPFASSGVRLSLDSAIFRVADVTLFSSIQPVPAYLVAAGMLADHSTPWMAALVISKATAFRDGWRQDHAAEPQKAAPPEAHFLRLMRAGSGRAGLASGLPLEVLPWRDSFEERVDDLSFSLTKTQSGKEVILVGALHEKGVEVLRVRQRWIDGEPWWRDYSRHVRGVPDLHAWHDPPVTPPCSSWTPGSHFTLEVKQWPRDGTGTKPKEFTVHAGVPGSDKAEPPKWTLGLSAGKGGEHLKEFHYYVWMDSATGWTSKTRMFHIRKPRDLAAEKVSTEATLMATLGAAAKKEAVETLWVTAAPVGFPVELFPLEPGEFPVGKDGGTLRLRRTEDAGELLLEASYQVQGEEILRVHQTWKPGEPWWRSYERLVMGKKDLTATRVSANVPKTPIQSPEPKKPATPPESFEHLQRDPRLRVLMNLKRRDGPDLWEIVVAIEEATKLFIQVDPKLKNHDPQFGSLQLKDVPAWWYMKLVANTGLEGGRWEKTEGGYLLTAKATLAPKAEPKPPTGPDVFHLRRDRRLLPRVDVEGQFKLEEVLKILNEGTGLTIALADNLHDHDPDLGYAKLPRIPAWSVMEWLTKKALEEGRWDKTDTGYRLTGKSLRRRPGGSYGTSIAATIGILATAGTIVHLWRRTRPRAS